MFLRWVANFSNWLSSKIDKRELLNSRLNALKVIRKYFLRFVIFFRGPKLEYLSHLFHFTNLILTCDKIRMSFILALLEKSIIQMGKKLSQEKSKKGQIIFYKVLESAFIFRLKSKEIFISKILTCNILLQGLTMFVKICFRSHRSTSGF